jgi:antitoxin (DNA-binding transcriptional repressor) of toxin-antitoxin stability system
LFTLTKKGVISEQLSSSPAFFSLPHIIVSDNVPVADIVPIGRRAQDWMSCWRRQTAAQREGEAARRLPAVAAAAEAATTTCGRWRRKASPGAAARSVVRVRVRQDGAGRRLRPAWLPPAAVARPRACNVNLDRNESCPLKKWKNIDNPPPTGLYSKVKVLHASRPHGQDRARALAVVPGVV